MNSHLNSYHEYQKNTVNLLLTHFPDNISNMIFSYMSSYYLARQIEIENQYAFAMLNEILVNDEIFKILNEVSLILKHNIFDHIAEEYKSKGHNIHLLSKASYHSISYLSREHSKDFRQRQAIFPNKLPAEIIQSEENIQTLLDREKIRLIFQEESKTIDKLTCSLKAILEMGYCFFEYFVKKDIYQFEFLSHAIMPTSRELNIRLRRKKSKFSMTQGIGQEPWDITSENDRGHLCGKTVFKSISTVGYVDKITREAGNQNVKEISAELKNQLNDYGIRLNEGLRLPNKFNYPYTFIERMALASVPEFPIPLVASTSSTIARLMITLLYFGFFNQNGTFNFDKVKIVANCFSAFLIYEGHHSFIEVAEIYNRVLDAIAILALNMDDKSTSQNTIVHQFPCIGKLNYPAFFHTSYKEKVQFRAERNPARSILEARQCI
jgi:hypothetical protein